VSNNIVYLFSTELLLRSIEPNVQSVIGTLQIWTFWRCYCISQTAYCSPIPLRYTVQL